MDDPAKTAKTMKKETEEEAVLRRFMQEFFPFNELLKVGFFTKDMRGNYAVQAQRVCEFFGYRTVYEHGAEEVRCHITYDKWHRPAG